MTTDIKELVKILRDGDWRHVAAADALEAMAGEVERLKDRDAINATCHFQAAEINKLETERDRLKAALVRLKTPTNISANERIVIAEEALGGDAS